jgi:hypothetical protein
VKIHTFSSSGEAYNASQTHDEIKDGDILSVPSERVVGVLIEAWPTAVSEKTGEFHSLHDEIDWAAIPTDESSAKDYSASFELAVEELDRICLEESR